MANFAHNWFCAESFHSVDDGLREFDVGDDFWLVVGVFVAGDEVFCEEEGEVIGAVVVAFFVDDADAIAVAVEADSEVGFCFADFFDEVGHVVELFWVCFVVGESSVGIAVEFDDFGAYFAEKFGGEWSGNSVAGVDDYFDGFAEWLDLFCEFFCVLWPDVLALFGSFGFGFVEIAGFCEFANELEFWAADGVGLFEGEGRIDTSAFASGSWVRDGFDAVIFFWVVRCCDICAAIEIEFG